MERLRFLRQAFAEGLITASEYKEHKRAVLCGVTHGAKPCKPKAPSAAITSPNGEPITLAAFERAVQQCIHALLVLVNRLAVACARHVRAQHATLGQVEAVAAHDGPPVGKQHGTPNRASAQRATPQTGATHPASGGTLPRAFVFDKQGRHARGGKSVQQCHHALDGLQVRIVVWLAGYAAGWLAAHETGPDLPLIR